MKNTKLRVAWMIPNVFCYLMWIGCSVFIFSNIQGLQEINRLSIWICTMIVLLFVSIFGSVQIRSWIKEGKM